MQSHKDGSRDSEVSFTNLLTAVIILSKRTKGRVSTAGVPSINPFSGRI